LVTGAKGFIGSCISKYFKDEGYDVAGWDIAADDIGGIQIDEVNMLKFELVKLKLDEVNPNIIIHCAGSADVGKSVKYPNIDFENNVIATHNLFFAMQECGMSATKIIFLSSAAVYGNPSELPIREDAAMNPLSPYALHKEMGERICKYFVSNYGFDIKILRIFSAYGVGLKKQIFWDMEQKIKNTKKLEMFGTGNESRDFINIEDLIRAVYIIAVTAPKTEMLFNVANGEEVYIKDIVTYFANSYGVDSTRISFNGMAREGDPLNWRADISKLEMLGYKPKVNIEEGIARYVKWIKKF